MDNKVANNIEIRVIGLMRNGNHAIIEWIMDQYKGKPICFLNNIPHGIYDPFLIERKRKLKEISANLNLEELRRCKKHLLLYSYEDSSSLKKLNLNILESVNQTSGSKEFRNFIGKSDCFFDIYILRDPLNAFASRLKMLYDNAPGLRDIKSIAEQWKIIAKKALEIDESSPNEIFINYNTWCSDSNYRRELSKRLGGEYSESTLYNIPNYGGGSSFMGASEKKISLSQLFKQRVKILNLKRILNLFFYVKRIFVSNKTLDTNNRWQAFQKDQNFRNMILDKELLSLYKSLFKISPEVKRYFVDNMDDALEF